MIKNLPKEQDFGEWGQLLVRKGRRWEVMTLAEFQGAQKWEHGMATLFYSVDEWRNIL